MLDFLSERLMEVFVAVIRGNRMCKIEPGKAASTLRLCILLPSFKSSVMCQSRVRRLYVVYDARYGQPSPFE